MDFLALSEKAYFIYKTTTYYDPASECCIRWNDPDIGIEWPLSQAPTLSVRDQSGLNFHEAEYYP